MSETSFSALFSLMLKETMLSEQGVQFKISTLKKLYMIES